MSTLRRLRIVLFCCLSFPACPQQSASPPEPANTGTNRRITLDVVVADKSEKPVPGLQQRDFTVMDDKRPQTLVAFQAVAGAQSPEADPPVEIILLIDKVNTPVRNVATAREETKKFLRQNGGQLAFPVSIIFVTDSGTSSQTATRDGNALIAALDQDDSALRETRRSQGVYGADERLQLSLNALNSIAAYEATKPGKKMLIWLSPGWPILAGAALHLSAKDEQGIFSGIVAASTALRQARITLYSVDPLGLANAAGFGTSYYREFVKGVSAARQAQPANLALQVLVYQSGGRVMSPSNDIAGQIARCVADANAYYVLSFDSPAADGPNEYHALDVRIARPGLTARTRTGYYAQP